MQSFFPLLFLLLFLVLAAVGGYFSYLQQKQRREALAALAAQLGWHFVSQRDSSHDDEYAHFEIFRRGHSRYAYNTLIGKLRIDDRDFPAKMGDFQYRVRSGSGKSRRTRTYRFSYVILHLPFPRVPDLLVRPEGMFDQLAGVFGFDDIDFESAEFSRRFYVKSPDKRFAYAVIHPRMMEFLLESSPPTLDIEDRGCCLSDGRSRWTPGEFQAILQWAQRFFRLWPDHLIDKRTVRNMSFRCRRRLLLP